ncbi:MAG TPA: hypothetical protein VFM54_10985, partial [Micromonosporaceae bacterium]|nr:hypothetical protein [Micromonosporaceae bacterium]
MLGTQLAELLDGEPAGLAQALELVNGLDAALVHGFVRVGEERAGALADLAGALAATPLGDRVAEAVGKVTAGSVADEHLVAFAGARAALLGAGYDALLARFDAVLGRDRLAWQRWPAPAVPLAAVPPAGAPLGGAANALAACRSWLHELAITGWRGVDHDLVAAAGQPIEAALAVPVLRRLAVVLDGLA